MTEQNENRVNANRVRFAEQARAVYAVSRGARGRVSHGRPRPRSCETKSASAEEEHRARPPYRSRRNRAPVTFCRLLRVSRNPWSEFLLDRRPFDRISRREVNYRRRLRAQVRLFDSTALAGSSRRLTNGCRLQVYRIGRLVGGGRSVRERAVEGEATTAFDKQKTHRNA